jgi:hypothetical protein
MGAQLGAQAPKPNVFESASRVWHEDRASQGDDALERGGKLKVRDLRSFAHTYVVLLRVTRALAVRPFLPFHSFFLFPPPFLPLGEGREGERAPSLPLPSAFSLSSSFSLPSLLPLSLPSPSPRNADCFSGWGWQCWRYLRYSALAAMRTGVCVALRV